MNSYHKDLQRFEELLTFRHERELTEDELEQFCQLIEEYPHFVERIAKDTQVEVMLKSLKAEEYRELGFKLPAKNIIKFPGVEEPDTQAITYKDAFFRSAAVLLFATLLVALYAIQIDKESLEVNQAPAVVIHEVKKEAPRPLTAQELYEKQIAKIPETGSMKRPPTKFSNAAHSGEEMDYGREIRPILSEYCFHCHGPDEHSREAKLRLDTADGMLKDHAIVPGFPEKSEVMARILHDDPDEIMPPPKSHKTMTPEEIEKVRLWILQGAKWERHWAYINPVKVEAPKAEAEEWNENPIDQFVYAGMKKKGLTPNPKADPYVLARRVAFDLTGLPLPPEKINQYVEENTEGQYSKLVDALMETKAYGEHRAHYWLDAARYGDTHGLHNDRYREMYLYRDWVIDAFNNNMPFDQFTIEQFAGDLLPNSTTSQKIATGFHRCNVTSNEGGTIDEELLVRYNVDRVSTTGTVFMGLTVGCAQCHDHKFDPISQKEFYELFAFFNNTTQRGRDGGQKNTAPSIIVPKGEKVDNYHELKASTEKLEKELAKVMSQKLPENIEIDFEKLGLEAEEALSLNQDLSQGNQHVVARVQGKEQVLTLTGKNHWLNDKKRSQALNLETNEGIKLMPGLNYKASQAMSLSFWIKPDQQQKNGSVFQQYQKKTNRGWRVQLLNSTLTFQLLSDAAKNNNLYVTSNRKRLAKNRWNHVLITYDGSRHSNGVAMYIDGKSIELKRDKKFQKVEGSIENNEALIIGSDFKNTALAEMKIYLTEFDELEAMFAFHKEKIELNLKKDITKLNKSDQDWVKKAYHLSHNDSFAANLKSSYQEKAKLQKLENSFPTALVMNEKSEPAMAYILDRGEYDKKKDKVTPAVPEAIGAWKDDYPKNRLGLAKWLVSKENPLTARVTMNRLWQEFFGHGIVRSADDFGFMGARPTHPELLDWLAIEFIESGWDLKHMVRLIVSSKTYQQSSQFSDLHHQLDPENHFLARGPRFRLRAEALRDQALAVSGLLVDKVGGKSVKPYQPAGLWKALFNTSFVQDKGEDLYRRSVYTFWKRTIAPPSMVIFNAPSRETCIVKRENTNTPMQALTLMNDVQFVEAARVLAERMMLEEKSQTKIVRSLGYRVLGYPVSEREQSKMVSAFNEYHDYFKENADEAKEFVTVGEFPLNEKLDPVELSAWTMLASTLMNRDDVINKN